MTEQTRIRHAAELLENLWESRATAQETDSPADKKRYQNYRQQFKRLDRAWFLRNRDAIIAEQQRLLALDRQIEDMVEALETGYYYE